jgi:putative Holliday junction resolvase
MYLAFDFGMRFIGVAVGQMITKTARPLSALKAKKGAPQWDQVKRLIDEWKPEALIVGLPLNMDGTNQWVTDATREFCSELSARFGLPVIEVDERLSTVAAKELIFAQDGYKGLEKTAIDSMSAKLILETWLSGG